MSACSACAAELPDGAKFCAECGSPTAKRACPSCGTPAETGRFCPECGTALDGASPPAVAQPAGPVAERRVTSVLFGDLVGFTPLSESMDSEEVRELLSAYFQQSRVIVARYGGAIEKFIGDAVMAVWGVPVAHEDDAERSVRAGLELVAMVTALGDAVGAPGLAQRVGIVTGEVAVTVGATAEGMVAGDAVNTAARVQSAAAPGQVWVDETTRGLASAAITFEDVGEHELKGKADPMRLWRAGIVVAEVGGGQRVDGLEAAFTGRDADLRLLKELFHGTQESRRPRLVVLDGEAGVGKSRLAWEFEKYVDGLTASIRWHRGRCLSYGDGVAFWALAEAMRTRFGLVEADTGDIVTERLDAGLQTYVPDAGERDWLRPRLAGLLGEAGAGSYAREDLFAAWTAFLERLAEGDSIVVLVLDDAQHADDGLLDLLDHVSSTARASIFVLALARPDLLRRRPDLGGRRTTVVRLEPLDDDAMATLVDGLVADLPTDTRSALVERSEGVPLFAVETVRALIDRDLVVPREGRYVTADDTVLDLEAIGAPATLQALVAARLDSLSAAEKRVVADASVLGLSFTRDGLLALGSTPQMLDPVLDSLRRRQIFTVQTDRFSAERGQYRFVQSVVRQVALATMSKRDRKIRHLAAADHLATEPDLADDLAALIAQHLLDALDASTDGDLDAPGINVRACAALERAAGRARIVGAPNEARRLFESALALSVDVADQARMHLGVANAAAVGGQFAEGRDHAETAAQMFDQLSDPVSAGLSTARLARSLMVLGDVAAAISVAERRSHLLAGVSGAEPAQLALAHTLAEATLALGDMDAAVIHGRRMLQLAEGLGDREALALALHFEGRIYLSTSAATTALIQLTAAAAISREGLFYEPLARILVSISALQNSRDVVAGIAHAEEATEIARRLGMQPVVDHATLNHLIGLWLAGRLEDAHAIVTEAWDRVVDPALAIDMGTIRIWIADAKGQPVPQDDLEMHAESRTDLAWRASAEIARLLSAGNATGAAGIVDEAIDHLVAATGVDDDFMVLWPPLVRAALAAGEVELAERLLDPVAEALPGVRSPAVAAQWHSLRGRVSAARGDDPDFAETEMRVGIEALESFGAIGYRAQAQEELARWLVEQHRAPEAAPLFDAARATYIEIGATGWLAKLDVWLASRQSAPMQ
jgi:class 3 adenylate cyclase/tetratricopeptide (TPR) repeat protein